MSRGSKFYECIFPVHDQFYGHTWIIGNKANYSVATVRNSHRVFQNPVGKVPLDLALLIQLLHIIQRSVRVQLQIKEIVPSAHKRFAGLFLMSCCSKTHSISILYLEEIGLFAFIIKFS